MPHFRKGKFSKDFEYRALPFERWRRIIHLGGLYVPYMAGQRVNFKLRIRQLPENPYDDRNVTLYRNEPGVKNQDRSFPIVRGWREYDVLGSAAPSNGAVEYRFGLPVEETSQVVVSVHGNQNDAIVWILFGIVAGILIPWLLGSIPAAFDWIYKGVIEILAG